MPSTATALLARPPPAVVAAAPSTGAAPSRGAFGTAPATSTAMGSSTGAMPGTGLMQMPSYAFPSGVMGGQPQLPAFAPGQMMYMPASQPGGMHFVSLGGFSSQPLMVPPLNVPGSGPAMGNGFVYGMPGMQAPWPQMGSAAPGSEANAGARPADGTSAAGMPPGYQYGRPYSSSSAGAGPGVDGYRRMAAAAPPAAAEELRYRDHGARRMQPMAMASHKEGYGSSGGRPAAAGG